jgi:hypothetical protein
MLVCLLLVFLLSTVRAVAPSAADGDAPLHRLSDHEVLHLIFVARDANDHVTRRLLQREWQHRHGAP